MEPEIRMCVIKIYMTNHIVLTKASRGQIIEYIIRIKQTVWLAHHLNDYRLS